MHSTEDKIKFNRFNMFLILFNLPNLILFLNKLKDVISHIMMDYVIYIRQSGSHTFSFIKKDKRAAIFIESRQNF